MTTIQNQTFDQERALYGSRDLLVRNCSFNGPADGESAFKECAGIQVEHSFFNLRYPFWHAKNVVVRNCTVKGEYLAWYCENVTFDHCTIIGTQPLCYCKGLKLIDCRMVDCDLAFERSEVQATVTTSVVSIKNPLAGSHITLPEVGTVIRDIPEAVGEIVVAAQNQVICAQTKARESRGGDEVA